MASPPSAEPARPPLHRDVLSGTEGEGQGLDLGHADGVGDSTDILAVAARELGADPERSFRILWGVDFERFRPRDARPRG